MKKKKTAKQIAAIVCIVLLVALYLITLLSAVFAFPGWQRLMSNVNFDDYESRMWFDKALRESGLYQQLEERGIEDGDTVSLDGYEFEYQI